MNDRLSRLDTLGEAGPMDPCKACKEGRHRKVFLELKTPGNEVGNASYNDYICVESGKICPVVMLSCSVIKDLQRVPGLEPSIRLVENRF